MQTWTGPYIPVDGAELDKRTRLYDALNNMDRTNVEQYMTKENKVFVDQSTIDGANRGVFARVRIEPGDFITWYAYTNELKNTEQQAYAMRVNFKGHKSQTTIFGLVNPEVHQGFGSLINHLPLDDYRLNAAIHIVSCERVAVMAISEVKAGAASAPLLWRSIRRCSSTFRMYESMYCSNGSSCGQP